MQRLGACLQSVAATFPQESMSTSVIPLYLVYMYLYWAHSHSCMMEFAPGVSLMYI